MKGQLYRLGFFFMFFPYVGTVKSIDIQPFFVVVTLPLCLIIYSFFKEIVSFKVILLSFLMFIPVLFRILVDENLEATYLITYVFSFLTGSLAFIFSWKGHKFLSLRLFYFFVSFYILVGLAQLFFDRNFLTFLLSRANGTGLVESLIETGRGVVSLTAEPSQFGKLLIIFNLLYVILIVRDNYSNLINNILYSFVFFILCNIFLSISAYMILFHVLIFGVFLFYFKFKTFIFGVFSFLALLFFATFEFEDNIRFFDILNNSNNLPYLFAQGAFNRLMNIPISFVGFLRSDMYGLGNSNLEYFDYFKLLGEDFNFVYTSRNLGGFIEYLLRFGLFAVPFYIFYFYTLWKVCFIKVYTKDSTYKIGPFLALSILYITLQDGSTLNPLVWFTYFLAYKMSFETIKLSN